jgi:photosystem II stability/assembly factor-like uncharacterized protein
MRTLIHTLFFFLLVTQICFAQWYQQNSGTTKNLYAVHFTDENNGIAVGDSGTILRTTNGGTAWVIQASGTILPLNDIFFTDVNNGWAVGCNKYSFEPSVIIHTTDGGTTWNIQLILPDSWLTDIFFIDENIGWVVGWPVILKTTNGGTTWIDQSSPYIYELDDVYFINANLGFIVGGFDGMYTTGGVILKTTNGGDNWSEQITDLTIHWRGISFSDSLNGIVVGRKAYGLMAVGSIFRTTDGGINWIFVSEDVWVLNSIEFADSNHSWIFGGDGWTDGTILFSSDKGLNWIRQGVFSSSLYSSCFINSSTGWAVGDNGTILQTTNGGVPVELTSFSATSNGSGVILNWSTATELNNQGFEIQRSTEREEFFTIGFVNGHGTTTEQQNYSYADRNLDNGNYFYRLKQVDYDGSYENSNVVEVEWRSFNSYLLEQNYPNPFNPTTIIGFGIQNKSNVKITILNAIGEEVAVLLNEEREAGFHQVEFNAANLPSGVYFYQLKAREFVETKKMLFLK